MGQVRALFPPQAPMPFTREVVREIDEGQMGCFGLMDEKRAMVYIGGGDIRAGLMHLLDSRDNCLERHAPRLWIGVGTPHWEALLPEFLKEYDPPCR
jgi:hypothetical protein